MSGAESLVSETRCQEEPSSLVSRVAFRDETIEETRISIEDHEVARNLQLVQLVPGGSGGARWASYCALP